MYKIIIRNGRDGIKYYSILLRKVPDFGVCVDKTVLRMSAVCICKTHKYICNYYGINGIKDCGNCA